MHTIHHTEAVIIKSEVQGESNKLFWLFTKDFGLIVALATGVRNSNAKLKGHLLDYASVEVDLVQGRDIWRLISATMIDNPIAQNPRHPLVRSYVRAISTVERFLIGEGEYGGVYDNLREAAIILKNSPQGIATDKFVKNYDALVIWRILAHLGYMEVSENERGLSASALVEAVKKIDESTRKKIITSVNQTIKETHL